MTPTVLVAIILWCIFVPVVFLQFPRRQAILASLAVGWMFLPVFTFSIPGMPDLSKELLVCAPIFLLVLFFPTEEWKSQRFTLQDCVVLLFCLVPFLSSMSNGLGIYDGFASVLGRLPMWLCPYLMGRLYFGSFQGVKMICWSMLIAGILYMPFCLWEIRMSPHLHEWVYGFAQKEFIQSIRGNTYRPLVFMETGLTLAMWMMMATYLGVQLWRTRNIQKLEQMPFFLQPRFLLVVLIGVFILCKSLGAILLFTAALVVFEIARWKQNKAILFAMVILPMVGLGVKLNSANLPVEQQAVSIVETMSEHRASSLQYRVDMETLLREKALEKPLLGWGGWGDQFIYNEYGEKKSVADGAWVIVMGSNGIIGLFIFFIMILLPAYRYIRAFPKEGWSDPEMQLTLAVMVVLPCYAMDCLVNDMPIPVYMLIAGCLTSLTGVRHAKENPELSPQSLPQPAFRYL